MLKPYDLSSHNNFIKSAKLYFCRLFCDLKGVERDERLCHIRVGLTISHLIKTNFLVGVCFNREFVITVN